MTPLNEINLRYIVPLLAEEHSFISTLLLHFLSPQLQQPAPALPARLFATEGEREKQTGRQRQGERGGKRAREREKERGRERERRRKWKVD